MPDRVQVLGIKCAGYKIFNMYVPPNVPLRDTFLDQMAILADKCTLILGDLNAQNPSWGSGILNHNGGVVMSLLRDSCLIFLNDGSPTRLTRPHENDKAPDLSMCTGDMTAKCSWTVMPDSGPSDHFPILIEVLDSSTAPPTSRRSLRKHNTKKADWAQSGD